jgi:hypothetical protein
VSQENHQPTIKPNKDFMRKHIEFIMQGMTDYKDGLIEISYGDAQNVPNNSKLFSSCDENVVEEIINFACGWNEQGRNLYIVPAYQDPWSDTDKRGNAQQFYATNTIAVDIDNGGEKPLTASELKIKYAQCRPNAVIVTGRKPNLRTWLLWKLQEPISDSQVLRPLVHGVIDKLDGDPAAKDATRLTRLGGSIAWATGKKAKSGRIHEVVEVNITNEAPVSIERLSAAYPFIMAKPRKPTGFNMNGMDIARSPDEIREMLGYINDYDSDRLKWLDIGMALNDGGYDFELWDTWSRKTSIPGKYDNIDIINAWNSLNPGKGVTMGTLVARAKDGGWVPRAPDRLAQLSTPIVSEAFPEAPAKVGTPVGPEAAMPDIKPATEVVEKPFQDIKFNGLIGDTIKDILATTQQQQPELATLNVLAALGAVFGRRYKSPMNTRTNLYTVGIASTGSGKDHSRKYIKELLLKANLNTFLGSDSLVSGAGLIASVEKHPSQVMMLDEFGMLLIAVKDKNTGNHLKICAKILTEFYSASNSTYYGGQYADKSVEPTKIVAPNLCIYGSTTLSKYVEALDKSVIESGELNRYIIIKPEKDFPDLVRAPKRTWPSDSLVGSWSTLAPTFGATATDVTPPIEVKWDWQEDKIWELQKYQSKMVREPYTGALWARYAENIIKVAMIMAIARSQLRPVMEVEDVDTAEALVRKSVEFMVTMATEQMFESEHDKQCSKMLNKVKKMDLGEAMRGLDTRARDGLLESLQDRGLIIIEKVRAANGKDMLFISLK